jgi:hypothetical protein
MLSKILIADLGQVGVGWGVFYNAIERMQGFLTQLFDSQGKATIVFMRYA